MKNICTPETARALEAAGFPQPEPELGQVWYDDDGEPCVCFADLYFAYSCGDLFAPQDVSCLVFAPTAVDILREMPEMRLYFYVGRWYLEDVEDEFVLRQFSDEIAAEACAAAWLATNKKDIEK